MTKTARSLKIFDMPLGDGGKPGRLYREQQRLEREKELFRGPRGLKIANAKDPINLFRKDGVTPLAELGARTNRGMMLKNAAIKQGKEHLLYGYKDTPEDIKTYQDLRKSNPGLFE